MRLIIVDGLDGVGKDTHAQLIKQYYEKKGNQVILRSHPEADNKFGRKTKKALLGTGKINRIIASIFFAFDVIRSLRNYYDIQSDDTLIMVRYLMATAYLPKGLAQLAYRVFHRFVPTSEYMFFLDASTDELLDRLQKRPEQEMFETREELLRVRKKAIDLAKGWYIIDTSQSIEKTSSQIVDVLQLLDSEADIQ